LSDTLPLAQGVVTDVVEFDTGDHLVVQTKSFPPIVDSDHMPPAHFDGALVHVHIGTKDDNRVLGNAAMVAPGIAIGARHVVESDLPRILSGELSIWGTAVADEGRLDIWNVRHVNTNAHTDLAIFSLVRRSAMPRDNMLTVVTTSTRIPAAGETVMIAGLRWISGSSSVEDGGRHAGRVTGEVRGAVGIVSDSFPAGRDRTILPGPCFAINVGTYLGMSGGPAFDQNGHFIGVLSTGLGDGDSTEGPSFISLVYPALWEPFLTAWPNALHPERTTLLDIDRRMCPIEGAERLSRVMSLDGEFVWTHTQ
jgi:hypothetical protein